MVEKKLVVVAAVPVARTNRRSSRFKRFAFKLVKVPCVEKKFVVVAAVPVAKLNVKFWRVDEPRERRLPKVPNPEVF